MLLNPDWDCLLETLKARLPGFRVFFVVPSEDTTIKWIRVMSGVGIMDLVRGSSVARVGFCVYGLQGSCVCTARLLHQCGFDCTLRSTLCTSWVERPYGCLLPRSCKMLCVCVVVTTHSLRCRCVCCALLCGVSAVWRLLRRSRGQQRQQQQQQQLLRSRGSGRQQQQGYGVHSTGSRGFV